MIWDLYVDESGDFESGKNCLIGGYMIPREAMDRSKVEQWNRDVLSQDGIKALMESYAIETGEQWYFQHCRKNDYRSPIRWELETAILERFQQLISESGGRIVVFDCPNGISNSDNTTNYLTVMAKGIFYLFHELKEDGSALRLHLAVRKNVTFSDETEELPVSPTAVVEPGMTDRGTILEVQYRRQLNNMAYLCGGADIAKGKPFGEMLDTLELLRDGTGLNRENPFTVICDYVCNLYYGQRGRNGDIRKRIRELFSRPGVVILNTEKPLNNGKQLDRLLSSDKYGEILLGLFSNDFPMGHTDRFFERFNQLPEAQQSECIRHFIETMREPVERQIEMPGYIARFDRLLKEAGRFGNEQVGYKLIANILLYQLSLYTHLGKRDKTKETGRRFCEVVDKINDGAVADELTEMYNNRMLVDYTDEFAYEEAEKFFHDEIKPMWGSRVEARRGRNRESIYAEYGKTLGSYLQLLRNRLHSEKDPETRELLYMEATELFENAEKHLGTDADKSRFHQTACDIEAEMGKYDEALDRLYTAAKLLDGSGREGEKAAFIADVAGTGGRQYPYLLQHLLRLLSVMGMRGADNSVYLQAVLPAIDENYGSEVRQIHPRTQILWKAAGSIAGSVNSGKEERKLAKKLYEKAYQQLIPENTTIFSAIAVAVKAEEMYFMKRGIIKGDIHNVYLQMNRAYEQYKGLSPEDTIDPFETFRSSETALLQETDDAQKYLELSFVIGY